MKFDGDACKLSRLDFILLKNHEVPLPLCHLRLTFGREPAVPDAIHSQPKETN